VQNQGSFLGSTNGGRMLAWVLLTGSIAIANTS
jgi:hypothetical protein